METARQELHGADAEDEDKQAEAKAVGAQRNQEQCARISRKCLERGVIVRMITSMKACCTRSHQPHPSQANSHPQRLQQPTSTSTSTRVLELVPVVYLVGCPRRV